jgi:recombinational DNA repair ATPase RecF
LASTSEEISMEDIVKLFKEGLTYYRKFLDLTLQMERTIDNGKIPDLKVLLAERAKILKEISADEEAFEKIWIKISDREQFSATIDEIRRVYEEIITLNQRIEKKMRSEKDQIHEKLTEIRKGRKVFQGYKTVRRDIPRYINKTG